MIKYPAVNIYVMDKVYYENEIVKIDQELYSVIIVGLIKTSYYKFVSDR